MKDKPDDLLTGEWFVAWRLDSDYLRVHDDPSEIDRSYLCFRRHGSVCAVPVAPSREMPQAQFDQFMLTQPPIYRHTLHYMSGLWNCELHYQALFWDQLLARVMQTILDEVYVEDWRAWDYPVRKQASDDKYANHP